MPPANAPSTPRGALSLAAVSGVSTWTPRRRSGTLALVRSLRLALAAVLGACAPVADGGPSFVDAPSVADVTADAGAASDVPTADAPRDVMSVDRGVLDAASPRDVSIDAPDVRDALEVRDVVAADRADVPTGGDDPAARSRESVCARWTADLAASQGAPAWSPSADRCDPGTLADATRAAGARLTNTFRWLAGLGPVAVDASRERAAQACALLCERNGALSHTPPMTWECWTSLGSDGAGHSNITGLRGFTMTPWVAVSGWIDDSRDVTMTLGHRRWMLWPPLGPVGYGQTAGYACLYVLGGSTGPRTRTWVAWPNAGFTPLEASSRIWSFSSASMGVGASTRVSVTLDGARLDVTAELRAPNYGDATVSWNMPALRDGGVYRVTVSGLSGGDLSYEVRPVSCR